MGLVIIEAYHCCLCHKKFYPTFFSLGADEIIGDHQCGFQCNRSVTDHIFHIHHILEKSGSIIVQYISYLYISRKPMIQLGEKHYRIFSLSLEHLGCV
jgi:hypothetical protein